MCNLNDSTMTILSRLETFDYVSEEMFFISANTSLNSDAQFLMFIIAMSHSLPGDQRNQASQFKIVCFRQQPTTSIVCFTLSPSTDDEINVQLKI